MTRKILLCERSQCFHLEFAIDSASALPYAPGQFLSCLANDPASGKQQTRAYSLASAPAFGNRAAGPATAGFDLCVNRVAGGFFSNLLCDLQPGETIEAHGPHGFFTLPESPANAPIPPLVLVAAGTGIAPMRGFLQALFAGEPTPGEPGQQADVWLVQGLDSTYDQTAANATPEASGAFYYREEFEQMAAAHSHFHYHPVAASADFQQQLTQILGQLAPIQASGPDATSRGPFPVYASLCGLNAIVAPARELFLRHGWAKRQVLFERYD